MCERCGPWPTFDRSLPQSATLQQTVMATFLPRMLTNHPNIAFDAEWSADLREHAALLAALARQEKAIDA